MGQRIRVVGELGQVVQNLFGMHVGDRLRMIHRVVTELVMQAASHGD